MLKTDIPELDLFIRTEIELIGGEADEDEKLQLFRILYNGIRTILAAQIQLPAKDDDTSSERAKRRIDIIKRYLEETKK